MESWGYVVLVAAFAFNILYGGLLKSYGVLLPSLVYNMEGTYATVGLTVAMFPVTMAMLCPISNALSKKIDIHIICTSGGMISAASAIAAGLTRTVPSLAICLFLVGAFCSPINQCIDVVIYRYFRNNTGAASAFIRTGSLIGGIMFPFLTEKLYEAYGPTGAMCCLGAIFSNVIPIALSLRLPRVSNVTNEEESLVLAEDNPSSTVSRSSSTSSLISSHETGTSYNEETRRHSFFNCLTSICGTKGIRNELPFALLMIPCRVISTTVCAVWAVFIVSYGVSEGLEEEIAIYLPMSGASGGLINRILLMACMHSRPNFSFLLLAVNAFISSTALIVSTVDTSFISLMFCSFFTAWGGFGTISAYYGVLGVSVSEENVPDIVALHFFATGITTALSVFTSGSIYDRTNSFRLVCMVLGSSMALEVFLVLIFYCIWRNRR